MKLRGMASITGVLVAASLIIPIQLAAQDGQEHNSDKRHHHYKLIDVGTLGGPHSYSFLGGFGLTYLNNQGAVAGFADTSTPDPNCFVPDCFVVHAFRWQNGALTDLAALPGVNSSGAIEINAHGWIAGYSQNSQVDPLTGGPEMEAVLWKHDEIVPLGTLGGNESLALDLNNRGQVIGVAANAVPDSFSMFGWGTQTRTFLWEHGVMKDLGTLGGPDAGGGGGMVGIFGTVSLNENGQVAGVSYTNSVPDPAFGVPTQHLFLWEEGQGMRDLGTLGGTAAAVTALNNHGQIAGESYLKGNVYFHPFLWSKGALRDLGTLGGNYGITIWLTESGDTVGWATTPGDQANRGTFWRVKDDRVETTDLGTVDGDGCSEGDAVNSRGQVVGSSYPCDNSSARASLWENGSMIDLNTLVPPDSGLHLVFAGNINEEGEILVMGVPHGDPPNTDLLGRLILLIPCDENHAGEEGCDYSRVESTTAVQAQPAATGNVAKLSRAELAAHNRWFGVPHTASK